jgi:hypothetical protein
MDLSSVITPVLADFGQQRVVLHIPGSDLEYIGIFRYPDKLSLKVHFCSYFIEILMESATMDKAIKARRLSWKSL